MNIIIKNSIKIVLILTLVNLLLFLSCKKSSNPNLKNICVVQFIDSPMSEETKAGLLEGLKESGMKEGTDYSVKSFNANGDISTLNSIIDKVNSDNYDIIIVTSTPTLQAALNKIKTTPVVFTLVADPVLAGAGKSYEDHISNVTGISTLGDYGGMIEILTKYFPNYKKMGTLFSPGEVNSVKNKDDLNNYISKSNLQLETAPVNSASDILDASNSLVNKGIDAVCQVLCNLIDASFPTLVQSAEKSKKPIFGFTKKQAEQGALLCLSRDYVQAGKDAIVITLRILKGEKPDKIPFSPMSKSELVINKKTAKAFNIPLPEELLKRADKIIE